MQVCAMSTALPTSPATPSTLASQGCSHPPARPYPAQRPRWAPQVPASAPSVPFLRAPRRHRPEASHRIPATSRARASTGPSPGRPVPPQRRTCPRRTSATLATAPFGRLRVWTELHDRSCQTAGRSVLSVCQPTELYILCLPFPFEKDGHDPFVSLNRHVEGLKRVLARGSHSTSETQRNQSERREPSCKRLGLDW